MSDTAAEINKTPKAPAIGNENVRRNLSVIVGGSADLWDNKWRVDENDIPVAWGHFEGNGTRTVIDEEGDLKSDLLYLLVEHALNG